MGVSALVRARHDSHEDSVVEKRLLQWLQLVQVSFLQPYIPLTHGLNPEEQLLHALCNRKPFPKHIATTAPPPSSSSLASLLRIVSGVAPLLEAVDSSLTSMPEAKGVDVGILFGKLFILESQLSAWLRMHLQQHYAAGSDIQVNSSSSSKSAKPNIFDLTCESLCRISLLLTVESLDDLRRTQPQPHHQTYRSNQLDHHHPVAAIPTLEVIAAQLCNTTLLLVSAASTPITRARVASGPVHFLQEFFTRKRDEGGLRWCAEVKERVCRNVGNGGGGDGEGAAALLRWDALLPWCLLDFHQIFVRD